VLLHIFSSTTFLASAGRDGHGGVRHSVMAIQQLESIARDGIATLRCSPTGVRGQIINGLSCHAQPVALWRRRSCPSFQPRLLPLTQSSGSVHSLGRVARPPTARGFLTHPLARRDVPLARARALNSLDLYLGERPRLPFTARIERAPFHRARSASKKGTWPLPPHPSEAARCASTEDHQAPSPPLFQRPVIRISL
jgi:hypothetical protein